MTETSQDPAPMLAQVYWRNYTEALPDSLRPHSVALDALGPEMLAAVEQGAQAVAAHVADPAAEDYDRAAEEMARRDEPAPVIVVTDEHGREHRYEDSAVDLRDGALVITRSPQGNVTAIYAERCWEKAHGEDAEVARQYYREGKKLAIALDALTAIADGDENADRAAETALAAIAELDL